MPPRAFEARHGPRLFWRKLAAAPDFYGTLPLLPDAEQLVDAVRHLDPIILTGCPMGGWAEAQKEAWAARHFPDLRIITCMARNKRDHAEPGDILVDDTLKHRARWEDMGGLFVPHTDTASTLDKLRAIPELGL
ncbi:hypothetical protein Q0812_00055 [Brevundimonas sp. 2R-24]|uniref:Uncharacterized protein n=1 Tax=Peiella sedimenti TaxID=3061083 RepID=A0ABT8SGV5_9CAUL|nr:hypothetical protein [Caulobacteraceae bacterium XZ-24]